MSEPPKGRWIYLPDESGETEGEFLSLPDIQIIPYTFDAVDLPLSRALSRALTKTTINEGLHWITRRESTSPTSIGYYYRLQHAYATGIIVAYQSGSGTVLRIDYETAPLPSALTPSPTKHEIEFLISKLDEWLSAAIKTITISMPTPEPQKRTAVEIIKKYYLRRGQMQKLTFRQHLRDLGEEQRERYLRKAKVAYDKRRKRGKKG